MTDPRNPDDLAEPLRSEVKRLMALDPRVSLTSGFRSRAQQEAAREANGCRGRVYDASCKGSPTTAIPGKSRHEFGQAADLADGTGARSVIDGLIRDHGLKLKRTVPGESWHFEHTDVAGSPLPSTPGAQPGVPQAKGVDVGGALELVRDPGTYMRMAYVVGGLTLVVLGILAIASELTGIGVDDVVKVVV